MYRNPCIVGATGFEPATSASRTQRSTKLSHAPSYLLTNKSMSVTNNNLSQFFIKIKCILFFHEALLLLQLLFRGKLVTKEPMV